MAEQQPAFDAAKYKNAQREQWNKDGAAWRRWTPTLERWYGEATRQMLDLTRIQPGQRILDVAAGAGEPAVSAAERVGISGYVLATDISSNLLRYAAHEAKKQGLANVETERMDGENLDVPESSFDAVISRVGLIYFPDQQKALAGMRRALKPGGRVAAIVYSTPDKNQFFSTPVSIIRRHANLGPPLPGQPGPFSLGGPGVIEAAFAKAGFRDFQAKTIPSPLEMSSSKECLRFEQESFGALHQMLSGLDDAGKQAAWQEIAQELAKFETPKGFVGPCEMIVAVGVK